MRMEIGLGALGAAVAASMLAALVAGCGGRGNKAASTQSMTSESPQNFTQTLERIMLPATAAILRFNSKASRWNDATTTAQTVKDAAPVVAALQKADDQLLHVRWPSAVRADIKAFVRAEEVMVGDLSRLATLGDFLFGDWSNQFSKDANLLTAAAAIVRADFGLPSP